MKTKIGVREVIDDSGEMKYLPYIAETGWFGIVLGTSAVCVESRREEFIRYWDSPYRDQFTSDVYDSEKEAIEAAESHLLWHIKYAMAQSELKKLKKQCKIRYYELSDNFIDKLYKL